MATLLGQLSKVLEPIIGSDTAAEDRAVRQAIEKQAAAYQDIALPDLQAPELIGYQDLGAPLANLSYNLPEVAQAQASLAGPSALSSISSDPRLAATQQQALNALDAISRSGGLTPQDLAAIGRINSEVAQADRGRREAILQNFNARGMGGSGNELLALLDSSQAATDQAAQQGMDINALAAQRALDAVMSSGQLAGQLRSQDYGEKSAAAQAQDAIDRFNAANRTAANAANVSALNQAAQARAQGQMGAQQFNFAAAQDRARQAQDIANRNVDTRNQTAINRANLPQQQFANEITKAGGLSDAAKTTASYNQSLSDRKAREQQALLDAAVKGGVAYATR